MATNHDLYLHEQVMLMALNDERGTLQPGAGHSHFALGAAVLAELFLRDRIKITDDKKKFVEVISDKKIGEPILDESLEKISTAKKRRRIVNWVTTFAHQAKVGQRVAQRLCDRGILREAEGKILLIFKRKLFPEIDPRPEQSLKRELQSAIWSETDFIKPRLATLIALAHGTGLLTVYFTRKELREQKKRIEEILRGEVIGGATREAIAAAEAAMMAVIIATTAATAAANSGG